MRKALVTGASRGIGLAIVKELLAEGYEVWATCRNPASSTDLAALADEHPERVTLFALDVADENSVAVLKSTLAGKPLDLLVNNAGIVGSAQQTFHQMDFESWKEVLTTNLLGPFRVSQALHDNLKRGDRPTNVIISSELGSSAWPHGGLYIYAASKGGLNRVIQMMSIDLKADGVCVIAMHPGLVKTDMAGDLGILEPAQSARGICSVIASLTMEDTGKFYQWDGTIHPW